MQTASKMFNRAYMFDKHVHVHTLVHVRNVHVRSYMYGRKAMTNRYCTPLQLAYHEREEDGDRLDTLHDPHDRHADDLNGRELVNT